MSNPPIITSSLVNAAIKGDRDAQQTVLLVSANAMRSAILRAMGPNWSARMPDVDADDVLQEAFTIAMRDFSKLDPERTVNIEAWLCRVAHNRVQDMRKKHMAHKRGGHLKRIAEQRHPEKAAPGLLDAAEADGTTPSQKAINREQADAVRRRMDGLPTDQRRALELHLVEENGFTTIVRIMGRSRGAIRALISRARRSLIELFEVSRK